VKGLIYLNIVSLGSLKPFLLLALMIDSVELWMSCMMEWRASRGPCPG